MPCTSLTQCWGRAGSLLGSVSSSPVRDPEPKHKVCNLSERQPTSLGCTCARMYPCTTQRHTQHSQPAHQEAFTYGVKEQSLWVWCLWLSGNNLLGTAFEVSGQSLWAGMWSGAQQEPVPSSHTAWGHMFDTSPLLSPVHVSNPDCSLQNLWSLGDHHRPSTRWLTQVPV